MLRQPAFHLTIAVGRPNCARTAEIDNREINETMKRVQKMSVARIIVVIIAGSPIITELPMISR